jgi:hypothetical protein
MDLESRTILEPRILAHDIVSKSSRVSFSVSMRDIVTAF